MQGVLSLQRPISGHLDPLPRDDGPSSTDPERFPETTTRHLRISTGAGRQHLVIWRSRASPPCNARFLGIRFVASRRRPVVYRSGAFSRDDDSSSADLDRCREIQGVVSSQCPDVRGFDPLPRYDDPFSADPKRFPETTAHCREKTPRDLGRQGSASWQQPKVRRSRTWPHDEGSGSADPNRSLETTTRRPRISTVVGKLRYRAWRSRTSPPGATLRRA